MPFSQSIHHCKKWVSIGIRATYLTEEWWCENIISWPLIEMPPNFGKCFPRWALKFHPACTRKPLLSSLLHCCDIKEVYLSLYWAILRSHQRSSNFQVSSTSRNECDASVSWLQSKRRFLFISPVTHCLTKPLIQLSFAPITRCILSTMLFDLSRHLYLHDPSSWSKDQQLFNIYFPSVQYIYRSLPSF